MHLSYLSYTDSRPNSKLLLISLRIRKVRVYLFCCLKVFLVNCHHRKAVVTFLFRFPILSDTIHLLRPFFKGPWQ
jgi:hypothetical protein